jgi:hypothetical protein
LLRALILFLLENENGIADPNLVTMCKSRLVHASAVDESAIVAPKILNLESISRRPDDTVLPRYRNVTDA